MGFVQERYHWRLWLFLNTILMLYWLHILKISDDVPFMLIDHGRFFIVVFDSSVLVYVSWCYACRVVIVFKGISNADHLVWIWKQQTITFLTALHECWESKFMYCLVNFGLWYTNVFHTILWIISTSRKFSWSSSSFSIGRSYWVPAVLVHLRYVKEMDKWHKGEWIGELTDMRYPLIMENWRRTVNSH